MSELPTEERQALLEVAETTAVAAGKLARERWHEPRDISQKGFRDLVTDVDIAAQKAITKDILLRFPTHGFLTEEEDSGLPTEGPIIWIIDPIDGTTNYSRQQPNYSVSVAAAQRVTDENGRISYLPIAAAIYDPPRQELFSAAVGLSANLREGNGRTMPLQVSHITAIPDSLLSLDWSGYNQHRKQILDWITTIGEQSFTLRAIGSAALALAWVAAGRLDGYYNLNVKPWDVAAAILLIEEAGDRLTDVQGKAYGWQGNGGSCLASNGRIHQALIPPDHAS